MRDYVWNPSPVQRPFCFRESRDQDGGVLILWSGPSSVYLLTRSEVFALFVEDSSFLISRVYREALYHVSDIEGLLVPGCIWSLQHVKYSHQASRITDAHFL